MNARARTLDRRNKGKQPVSLYRVCAVMHALLFGTAAGVDDEESRHSVRYAQVSSYTVFLSCRPIGDDINMRFYRTSTLPALSAQVKSSALGEQVLRTQLIAIYQAGRRVVPVARQAFEDSWRGRSVQ